MAVVYAGGYFYAILRAQFFDGFSHFVFDGGVLGLYLARFTLSAGHVFPRHAQLLRRWLAALVGWPVFLFFLCFFSPQHPLIQLVGLRAAVLFLPFLLLGAGVRVKDLKFLAVVVACLNVMAFGVALGEYFWGLAPFFPKTAVTEIMYGSKDIAEFSHYRIPSTFGSAAAYGGAMVASLPLLFGRWRAPDAATGTKLLLVFGLFTAALGVFMCGSRTPVIYLLLLSSLVAFEFRTRLGYLLLALIMAGGVAYFVSGTERLQRFTTLQDKDYISWRLETSANFGVIELALDYPMGAGLGSAWGTSIPSFMAHLADQPQLGAENEYSRIATEQGLPGVFLWLSFIVWVLLHRRTLPGHQWALGVRLMYVIVGLSWSTAFLGCGMLTAIPGTAMLLFQMGVLARVQPDLGNCRFHQEQLDQESGLRKKSELARVM